MLLLNDLPPALLAALTPPRIHPACLQMTNQFIKANATNSAQVRDQHAESRRSAETKMDHMQAGSGKSVKADADGRTTKKVGVVKGTDEGGAAKKDQELVLYEFIGMLVRIAFQRANPTFGNFGDQKKTKHLPGCLKTMIEDEIIPRARKDTSTVFRETVMTELSVLKVCCCERALLLLPACCHGMGL